MLNINIEDICNICTDILIENINIKSNQIKLKISTRNPNKVQLDSNSNVQLDSNSNVQLDSNSNIPLDSNNKVQLDSCSNKVQLDTDKNINLNPNLELLKILTNYRNIKKSNSKCKLCEICDLNGEIIIFKDLEFIDFLESNQLFEGDLTNFSLQNFFNHFNIINTSIPLNKYNILNGTILNDNILNDNILNDNPLMGNPLMGNPLMGNPLIGNPLIGNPLMGNILNSSNIKNKILKGLNYYIICLKLNKNQFENEIIIKFGSDIYINFSNYTLKVNRSTLVDKRLKSIVLNIFLRELNTIDQESILFKNFKKLQENHLLYEQLIQVKPCIEYDGEYILKIIRNKISFVGYYNKFHRNISQTNWYLDRPDIMSVEKCIGLPLKKILDAEEYKLIGAGREDVNVRNLGNGRKMALELKNTSIDPFLLLYAIDYEDTNGRLSKDTNGRLSKDTNGRLSEDTNGRLSEDTNGRLSKDANGRLSEDTNGKISNPTDTVTLYHKNIKIDHEKIILADKKLIKDYFIESDERYLDERGLDPIMDNIVVTFKNVKMTINCRIECQKIHYEIDKHTKSYNCLIYSENLLTHDTVNGVIDGLEFPILIKQKNPIRISHRRSQDTRIRQILELKLDLIHPRILLMYIKTQSGLYIKEFVNGDLGRTLPNLSKMLNTKLYSISLDVLNIM